MMTIYTLTFLTFVCVHSHGQKITLFEYRQEDSITNCTHGLVSDVDIVVFKAEVEFTDDNLKFVYFQKKLKRESEYYLFKSIVINGSEAAGIDTWNITRPNVAQVTIREKASTMLSGARIRGVIVTSHYNEIVSEEQIFPDIRDSTDLKSRLLVNGIERTTQDNKCDITVIGLYTSIIFECESQVLPCLIEISATDLTTPLCGKGYVLHNSQLPVLNITIKYATCTLQGKFNTINCHIKLAEATKDTGLSQTSVGLIAVILISVLLNMVFVIIGIYLWRSKQLKLPKVCCLRKFHTVISDQHHQAVNEEPDEPTTPLLVMFEPIEEETANPKNVQTQTSIVEAESKDDNTFVNLSMERLAKQPSSTLAKPLLLLPDGRRRICSM